MNTLHTPGPWKNPRPTISGDSLYIADKTGNWDIATVKISHAPSPEQAAANAQIIAAAPELLAALQTIAAQSVGADWTAEQAIEFCKEHARAAIAKIKGVPS